MNGVHHYVHILKDAACHKIPVMRLPEKQELNVGFILWSHWVEASNL